jgi:hypothetical protein
LLTHDFSDPLRNKKFKQRQLNKSPVCKSWLTRE